MRAGVGYANTTDASLCGREAASRALESCGTKAPSLVLAFASGQLDAQDVYDGVREVVGDEVPIVGGSAIGVITQDDLSYSGHPAAVAVLELDQALPGVAVAGQLDRGGREAGERLGRELSRVVDGSHLLLFYDSIKTPPTSAAPPQMNPSPELIEGIEVGFGAARGAVKSGGASECPPIVGAGVIGDFDFHPTWQFCGWSVAQQTAVGALLGPSVESYVQVMHGCTPLDGVYHVLGGVADGVIETIDGRPATEVIDEVYGSPDWREQQPVRRLSIGVNHGDRYAFNEDECVNRLITGVMPDGKSIAIFEPDLSDGEEVIFMLRDGDLMIESARRNATELMSRVEADGRRARFALYIDCAGRAAAYSETLTEEAAEVQAVMNERGVPLLGFYSGVELAPLLGRSRGLDWTGVLLMLAER